MFGDAIAEGIAEGAAGIPGIAGMDDGIMDAIADAAGEGMSEADGIVCAVAAIVVAPAIAHPAKTIPVNQRFT